MKFLLAVILSLFTISANAQTLNARLTLDPANPVMMADTVSTTLYYTDGVTSPLPLAGLSASTKHDIYVNSGALCAGQAWSGNTPPVADLQPAMTNAAQFTCSGGAVCNVGQCNYLGSILIDATAGQISCLFSYGQNRRCGVWNFYNQKPFGMKAGNPNFIWNPAYEPNLGPYAGDANNSLIAFVGRPAYIKTRFEIENWVQTFSGYSAQEFVGIGWDSQSVASGFSGGHDTEGFSAGGYIAVGGNKFAHYETMTIGSHTVYALLRTQAVPQNCVTNQASCIYIAQQEANMLLTAEYMN